MLTRVQIGAMWIIKLSIPVTEFPFSNHEAIQLLKQLLFLTNLKEYGTLNNH